MVLAEGAWLAEPARPAFLNPLNHGYAKLGTAGTASAQHRPLSQSRQIRNERRAGHVLRISGLERRFPPGTGSIAMPRRTAGAPSPTNVRRVRPSNAARREGKPLDGLRRRACASASARLSRSMPDTCRRSGSSGPMRGTAAGRSPSMPAWPGGGHTESRVVRRGKRAACIAGAIGKPGMAKGEET